MTDKLDKLSTSYKDLLNSVTDLQQSLRDCDIELENLKQSIIDIKTNKIIPVVDSLDPSVIGAMTERYDLYLKVLAASLCIIGATWFVFWLAGKAALPFEFVRNTAKGSCPEIWLHE